MLISFHSTMEFTTTIKGKPALILESGAKDKQSLGRLASLSAQDKETNQWLWQWTLNNMGPFTLFLLDKMGLDQMGLDKSGKTPERRFRENNNRF